MAEGEKGTKRLGFEVSRFQGAKGKRYKKGSKGFEIQRKLKEKDAEKF